MSPKASTSGRRSGTILTNGQSEVEKSAADVSRSAMRRRGGLFLPQAPASGPRYGILFGVDPADPWRAIFSTRLWRPAGRRAAQRTRRPACTSR